MSVQRFQRGIGTKVAFELHSITYILPAKQSKQSHGARRAVMSVERFHRGIGASKSGKCTHAARRVRVDVAVGERHARARSFDPHTSSLPTKEGARFRSVPGKGIHRGIGTWVAFELHRDAYILPVEQSKTATWRETSSHVS